MKKKNNAVLGIIPARFASTRFPGKPLALIGNVSMIERVYRQAQKSESLSEVIVATDDKRIFSHVKSFGGNVMMTSAKHKSGTDRCAEVIRKKKNFDIVINIQGDEPFIHPKQIDELVQAFSRKEVQIATLMRRITKMAELMNENIPKVIYNTISNAKDFTRLLRKFLEKKNIKRDGFFKHIGIYGYRADVLLKISRLKQSPREKAESLEQLRWLDNGYKIKTVVTQYNNHAVDTPEDVLKIKKLFRLK